MFNLAEAVGRWVLWGLMTAINGVIAALGAVLSAIASLFPSLPTPPGPPSDSHGVVGVISWLFPWGALLALITSAVALYLVILGMRVAARWVKLL